MTVVAVENKSATSKAGKPYKLVEVAFKNNTFQGKLESVKVNQYSQVFGAVAGMQPGQTYTVFKEKDTSGYYQWMSVTQAVPGTNIPVSSPAAAVLAPNNVSTAMSSAKNEYASQDARKQVYIVKQSAVKAAVDLLSIGAKTPPSTQLVLEQAQKFVDYVFEEKPLSIEDMTKLPNDIQVE